MIAEIKVLRSLQLRVNRRTAQVDQLLKSAQPEQKSELNQQLNELANRQLKLVDSAKEMSRKMSKP
jgi:small-conductance mechanosensitive channel